MCGVSAKSRHLLKNPPFHHHHAPPHAQHRSIPLYLLTFSLPLSPSPPLPTIPLFCPSSSPFHTATHCNTLQHTATHCNTLQHTTTHCNTLQHTATHCNTLQHTRTHCNTLQRTRLDMRPPLALKHTVAHCNTLQHTAPYYDALEHAATHCNASFPLWCPLSRLFSTRGLFFNGVPTMNKFLYSVLQYVAVCRSVLQCTVKLAVCCSAMTQR